MQLQWSHEAWARLGGRIRDERDRQGLTREQFAQQAGVSVGSIRTAERGDAPRNRWPHTLSKMEKALGWELGSMRAILDGGEATLASAAPIEPQGGGNAEAELEGRIAGLTDQLKQKLTDLHAATRPVDLPDDVEALLPRVLAFGPLCVEHGAPSYLGTAFTQTVYALLEGVQHGQRNKSSEPLPPAEEVLSRAKAHQVDLEQRGQEAVQATLQSIGHHLQDARVRAGLSAADVAERSPVGVGPYLIESMERGEFDTGGNSNRLLARRRIQDVAKAVGGDVQTLVDLFDFAATAEAALKARRPVSEEDLRRAARKLL